MNAAVVYDTYYGNTRLVAEALVEQLGSEGHHAELWSVRERHTLPQCDILFLGSPVRLGSVTGRVKRYIKKLDASAWANKPIVVFTTTLMLPEDATEAQRLGQEKHDWGAGRALRDLARARGLNAIDDHLWVEVEGTKGPIVDMGLEKAKQFAHNVLSEMRRGFGGSDEGVPS